MRRLLPALALTVTLLSCATAGATTLTATPSTFSSQFAAAQPGDIVELASGSYGTWTGGSKTGTVTIRPASGATPTIGVNFGSGASNLLLSGFSRFDGGAINGSSNITITGSQFTGPMSVMGGASNINFDTDTFNNLGPSLNEGRLGYLNASTGTVSNSVFSGSAGCSDGIMVSGGGGDPPTVTIVGNEFSGIVQGNCAAHTDPVQFYGGKGTVTDNYFHNNSDAIMSPDGNGSPVTVTNNVFVSDGGGYPWAIVDGGGRNDVFRHNVIVGGWTLEVGDRNGGGQYSVNETVKDNVLAAGITILAPQPASGVVQDYNLCGSGASCSGAHTVFGSASFVGGAGRCAYALAPGSPGRAAASDGADIGLSDCTAGGGGGGTVDHAPVARFVASPEPSAVGQTTTFDATATTCDDAPCSYHWHDVGSDGAADWPLGSDGQSMTFAFSGIGTKYVELVVTDADGDVSRIEHDHVVGAADTTPPDTSITAQPSNPTTSASASFSFTSSETGSTFECKMDAGAYVACTSPKTYSSETQLSVGTHTFSVRATDTAGNTDATPASYTWTINSSAVTLMGITTVGAVDDSNVGGQAQAYQYTASASGSAIHLKVYVNANSTAATLTAGLYSGASVPTTLLGKGSRTPTAGAWNDITIPATSVTSGTKYWIAILGTGGTLHYRDGTGGGKSYGSAQSNLTTLPASWSNGPDWSGSWGLSAYATT